MSLKEEIIWKEIKEYQLQFPNFHKGYIVNKTGYDFKTVSKYIEQLRQKRLIKKDGKIGGIPMYKITNKGLKK
jgi:predicted transcriptional regulator